MYYKVIYDSIDQVQDEQQNKQLIQLMHLQRMPHMDQLTMHLYESDFLVRSL